MFNTSLICTRNRTSSTTRPATQKPIAAPRCLSQAAPSPQANRRKGKLIMAQPLQRQTHLCHFSSPTHERITELQGIEIPKADKREEMIGSGTQLKESRPPSWAALTNRRQVSPASP